MAERPKTAACWSIWISRTPRWHPWLECKGLHSIVGVDYRRTGDSVDGVSEGIETERSPQILAPMDYIWAETAASLKGALQNVAQPMGGGSALFLIVSLDKSTAFMGSKFLLARPHLVDGKEV